MGTTDKKILLAVDGSDQSLNAVRYVSKALALQNMELVLFHVMRKIKDAFWDVGTNPALHSKVAGIRAWEETQKIKIKEFMTEARQILIDAGFAQESVRVDIHESEAGIARDIIKESNKGYNAVVLGRKGLSKVRELVMGSVTNKLIEKLTNIPVCMVGGTPWVGKLLVALDPSEGAMKAVDFVGTMWGKSNVEVTLMNVLRFPNIFHPEIEYLPPAEQRQVFERAQEEMNPVFEEAKRLLIYVGFNEQRISAKLISGVSSRAGAIVDEARHGGYGSIIIGRRGISKVEEFFMGRVSNKVVNLAKEMAVWVVS